MSVTMTRMLPDVQVLIRAVLIQSGAECGPDVPADLLSLAPRFTAYRAGGIGVPLMDRPMVHVIAWGRTYAEARDLGETGRALIFAAWLDGWSSPEGRVGKVTEVSAPSELRLANQPDYIHRFDADYRVNVRPAVTP